VVFRGKFPYQLDDRNRVPIPPRFRKAFDTEVLLVKAPDSCIQVFTQEAWDAEDAVLSRMAPYSEEARMTYRDFYGGTLDTPMDAQGRIVLPAELRQYAGIKEKGEVYVVGVKDRLEIWDRESFDAADSSFASARRAALERLASDEGRARARSVED
jgi:MraZ protein